MQEVPIRDEGIRLGQFLKLAGIADSGADAATMLADDTISGPSGGAAFPC